MCVNKVMSFASSIVTKSSDSKSFNGWPSPFMPAFCCCYSYLKKKHSGFRLICFALSFSKVL